MGLNAAATISASRRRRHHKVAVVAGTTAGHLSMTGRDPSPGSLAVSHEHGLPLQAPEIVTQRVVESWLAL